MPNKKNPIKVFLCSAHADEARARELYDFIRKHGVKPWLDEVDLLPGHRWEEEIEKALERSDIIIVCFSKNAMDERGYVQKEIRIALDMALGVPSGNIFIIPARFEDCELPHGLKHYRPVDLFRDGGYSKLMMALRAQAMQLERSTVRLPKPNESNPNMKKVVLDGAVPASTAQLPLEKRVETNPSVALDLPENAIQADQKAVSASTIRQILEKLQETKAPVVVEKQEPQEALKTDIAKNKVPGGDLPENPIASHQNAVPISTAEPSSEKSQETQPPVMAEKKELEEFVPPLPQKKKEPQKPPGKPGLKYIFILIPISILAVGIILACLLAGLTIFAPFFKPTPISTRTLTPAVFLTETPFSTNTPSLNNPTLTPFLTETLTPAGPDTFATEQIPAATASATQFVYDLCFWTQKKEGEKFLNHACQCAAATCTCDVTEDWERTPVPQMGKPPYSNFTRKQVDHWVLEFGGSCQ